MDTAPHNRQLLNWTKFRELVHYICEKAEEPSCLGKVKLNKVLWYSDVINYLVEGRSITGETYIKRQRGPVAVHVLRAIHELVQEGRIARGKVDHFGFMKQEYISIYPSDKNAFTGAEMAIIDEAFEHVCMHHTATSVSDETHNVIWELAEMGEEIPYYTVFATSEGEIDESDIAWAQERLKELV
jgi:hypothetical protein